MEMEIGARVLEAGKYLEEGGRALLVARGSTTTSRAIQGIKTILDAFSYRDFDENEDKCSRNRYSGATRFVQLAQMGSSEQTTVRA